MSKFKLSFESLSSCPCCSAMPTHFKRYDSVIDSLVGDLNKAIGSQYFAEFKNERVRCDQCKLIFMSPRLTSESLETVYSYWYKYAYNTIFEDESVIDKRAKEFRNYHLKILNSVVPQKGKLLDIGCGSGLFMSLAAKDGWHVQGVEFDVSTAEKAAQTYGLNVSAGKLEYFRGADIYDAVVSFDVLEHTQTPRQDIEKIVTLIKPGGYLLVRVPNSASLQAKMLKEKWVGYISNHLSYFDKYSLTTLLEANGFYVENVISKNYISQIDILKHYIQYAFKKVKVEEGVAITEAARSFASPSVSISRFSKLMRYINAFIVEEIDYIGGLFNMGNNLMIIAKKI